MYCKYQLVQFKLYDKHILKFNKATEGINKNGERSRRDSFILYIYIFKKLFP